MRFTTTAVYAVLAIFSTASSSMATPVNVRAVAPPISTEQTAFIINADVEITWDPTGFSGADVGTVSLRQGQNAINGGQPVPNVAANAQGLETQVLLSTGFMITNLENIVPPELLGNSDFKLELNLDGTSSISNPFTLLPVD